MASSLTRPIGMSAAITFQVASEATSSRFSQASCAAPRMQVSLWSSRSLKVESR
jgi:hypothetical protein